MTTRTDTGAAGIAALGMCLALASAGTTACSKHHSEPPPAAGKSESTQPRGPEHSPHEGLGASGQNPHAGMNMGGGDNPHAGMNMGGGDNPHAGMNMGGDNPHGGMAMGGGGAAGSTLPRAKNGRAVLGPLTVAVPGTWKERPTQSGMRAAEFTIPGVKGAADGELVIYYFGPGGAGSAEDNIARWTQQFLGPDGQPATPVVQKKQVAGMAMTEAEMTGRYVSSMSPAGTTEKHDSADWSMVGAVLTTSNGPYYFKMIGPKGTMAVAKKDFAKMLGSIKAPGAAAGKGAGNPSGAGAAQGSGAPQGGW